MVIFKPRQHNFTHSRLTFAAKPARMEDNVIVCDRLTHYYGRRRIYSDLSFTVARGTITGLLGKNGTGKTTTINILMGYLKPTAGRCSVFGEDAASISPLTRARIALLLEGHVQYSFMTIGQIEKFYSRFYPKWNKDAYYELMSRLKVAPGQKISSMSNGQKSQVALGLILAQNADLLVLDDFSLGLDPGYRRLFIEYLRDYAKSEGKTVFMTSHIIQDVEKLVDDCIIMDYGRILFHDKISTLTGSLLRYTYTGAAPQASEKILHPSEYRGRSELYSFAGLEEIRSLLDAEGIHAEDLTPEHMNLEDAFIGLTGKY